MLGSTKKHGALAAIGYVVAWVVALVLGEMLGWLVGDGLGLACTMTLLVALLVAWCLAFRVRDAWFYVFIGVLLATSLYCCGHMAVEHAPDEAYRLAIPFWIYGRETLPTGFEPELTNLDPQGASVCWGSNYAFSPYLSSFVALVLMKVASVFAQMPPLEVGQIEYAVPVLSEYVVCARLSSFLALVVTTIYAVRLSDLLFERCGKVFVILIVGMPQVLFLSACLNCDMFSLMATVMILYYTVRGHRSRWAWGPCVGLGVSYSIGLLSYYFGYGVILVTGIYAVADCLRMASREGAHGERLGGRLAFVGGRAGLVLGVILVLAGWYFIRNAIIYDGDFLGLRAQRECAEMYRQAGVDVYDPPTIYDLGLSWGSWLSTTVASLIGVFGYMDVLLPKPVYVAYGVMLMVGTVLYLAYLVVPKVRGEARGEDGPAGSDEPGRTAGPGESAGSDRSGGPDGPGGRSFLPLAAIVACVAIPFLLSAWRSATFDYQPQGRYVISSLPLIAYVVAMGFSRLQESRPYLRVCDAFGISGAAPLGSHSKSCPDGHSASRPDDLLGNLLCAVLVALWCLAAFGWVVNL